MCICHGAIAAHCLKRADSRRRGSGIVPIPLSGNFPRCGGRAFQLPAPRAHALQVTLGWLTVLVALILSITRQWTRIYRIYVNGKTERFHHALTDWLSLRPLATPLRLDGGVSSGAEHTTTTTIGLTWATATSYPDWSPSQPRGGSMALRRQRQAWNVKYALAVIPCEDTNCSPWGPEVVLPGASRDTKRTGPPQGGGPVVKVSGRLVGRC